MYSCKLLKSPSNSELSSLTRFSYSASTASTYTTTSSFVVTPNPGDCLFSFYPTSEAEFEKLSTRSNTGEEDTFFSEKIIAGLSFACSSTPNDGCCTSVSPVSRGLVFSMLSASETALAAYRRSSSSSLNYSMSLLFSRSRKSTCSSSMLAVASPKVLNACSAISLFSSDP